MTKTERNFCVKLLCPIKEKYFRYKLFMKCKQYRAHREQWNSTPESKTNKHV